MIILKHYLLILYQACVTACSVIVQILRFFFSHLICHCGLLALFCFLACNFVLHTCTALRIAQRFDRAVAMSVSKLKASQKLQMWWFWLSWLVYACWCCAELAQPARFVGTDWHCLHLEPWHYRFYQGASGYMMSSEAKLKVDWPTQIVFVQNKSWDNCLTHWVGQ